MEVKMLHLYYDLMNLYGEYGNVEILKKHLEDQGCTVLVDKKTLNEGKNLLEYDFIYIGCGTEKNQKVMLDDIFKVKDELVNAIEAEVPILLTGNSYEILGKTIGENEALGIFPFITDFSNDRITTDVICTSEVFKNKIVGFINTLSEIKENDLALFDIEYSTKNIEHDGVIYKNLIGTHLIGPLLIRNPEILDFFIKKIISRKDKDFTIKNVEYKDEQEGYKLVLRELENRKKLQK